MRRDSIYDYAPRLLPEHGAFDEARVRPSFGGIPQWTLHPRAADPRQSGAVAVPDSGGTGRLRSQPDGPNDRLRRMVETHQHLSPSVDEWTKRGAGRTFGKTPARGRARTGSKLHRSRDTHDDKVGQSSGRTAGRGASLRIRRPSSFRVGAFLYGSTPQASSLVERPRPGTSVPPPSSGTGPEWRDLRTHYVRGVYSSLFAGTDCSATACDPRTRTD
jgi:hypothetical protein